MARARGRSATAPGRTGQPLGERELRDVGQRVSTAVHAALGGSTIIRYALLASDFPLTGTTNWTSVTGYEFPVVAATACRFRFLAAYNTSNTALGVKFGITGPATPTLLHYRAQWEQGTTGTNAQNYFAASAYDDSIIVLGASSRLTGNVLELNGIIVPATSGNVTLRLGISSASYTATVKAGSSVEYY